MYGKIFSEYSRFQVPNGHAIADMALENYIEMRDSVNDPKYIERHFTILDKEETRDGKVSVTPKELQELKTFSNYTKEGQYLTLNGFGKQQRFNHEYYQGRFK